MNETEVIVIGAGIGGLAAATELQRRGCRCLVLEAASEPGGRMRIHRQDGFAAATQLSAGPGVNFALAAVSIANLTASLLVLVGTRGRHPGWVALLIVSVIGGVACLR